MKLIYFLLVINFAHIFPVVKCLKVKEKIDPELYKKLQNGEKCDLILETGSESKSRNEKQLGTLGVIPSPSTLGVIPSPSTLGVIPSTSTLFTVISVLTSQKSIFIVIWSTNQIVVFQAIETLVLRLAGITIVTRILPNTPLPTGINPSINLPLPKTEDKNWNLNLIEARCTDIKCFGDKVVVGVITAFGVKPNHPEIEDRWIGSPYGYLDAMSPTSSNSPQDSTGVGTAQVSIIVGKTIGVAPDAKWIACKACADGGPCTQAGYLICAQFMLCPWDTTKSQPEQQPANCPNAPKIVLVDALTRGTGQLMEPQYFWFYEMLQKWNDKKIISVFAVGNNGPNCNNGAIPAVYDNAFAVGAMDQEKIVTDWSARGPVMLDKAMVTNTTSNGSCPVEIGINTQCTGVPSGESKPCIYFKPDIVAPGQAVPIASIVDPNNLYSVASGTGFAAAHVAGVAALMICAKPTVSWNYKSAYKVLTENAERNVNTLKQSNSQYQRYPDSSHLFCDKLISKKCNSFPSNLYGWGVLNACKAVQAAKIFVK